MKSSDAAAWGLAAALGVAGVAHFVIPGFFDEIVPHALPGPPRGWTAVSGLAELACAAGIAVPSTRRAGATAAALVFVAVFPANVQMAIDWRSRPVIEQAFAYGRLPLQVPLVVWALRVRSDTRSGRRKGQG